MAKRKSLKQIRQEMMLKDDRVVFTKMYFGNYTKYTALTFFAAGLGVSLHWYFYIGALLAGFFMLKNYADNKELLQNEKKKVENKLNKEVNSVNELDAAKLNPNEEKVEIKEEYQIKQSEIKGVKTNEEFPYVVEMYDIWGATSKRAVRIGAKRWTDGKKCLPCK